MNWLVFDTEQQAREYSHAEALRHGKGRAADIIQYWWEVRETADGRWAVQCPEGTETPEFMGEENEII